RLAFPDHRSRLAYVWCAAAGVNVGCDFELSSEVASPILRRCDFSFRCRHHSRDVRSRRRPASVSGAGRHVTLSHHEGKLPAERKRSRHAVGTVGAGRVSISRPAARMIAAIQINSGAYVPVASYARPSSIGPSVPAAPTAIQMKPYSVEI